MQNFECIFHKLFFKVLKDIEYFFYYIACKKFIEFIYFQKSIFFFIKKSYLRIKGWWCVEKKAWKHFFLLISCFLLLQIMPMTKAVKKFDLLTLLLPFKIYLTIDNSILQYWFYVIYIRILAAKNKGGGLC